MEYVVKGVVECPCFEVCKTQLDTVLSNLAFSIQDALEYSLGPFDLLPYVSESV